MLMTQLGAVNPLPNTVLVTSLKQLIEFEKAMASLIHAFEASNLTFFFRVNPLIDMVYCISLFTGGQGFRFK